MSDETRTDEVYSSKKTRRELLAGAARLVLPQRNGGDSLGGEVRRGSLPGLTPASLVLALMQNVTGKVWVKAAVPDLAAGQFTVFLNKPPLAPDTATVAWFVVN
jgi:hypothetical protein